MSKISTNIINWLRLYRAQTAPATVLSILLSYLLAGGRNPLAIIEIIVVGTLLHWFSFGHNSVMDYWYDIHDPNKKHHPLEAGVIKLEHAHQVIHYGMVIVAGLLVLLTFSVSPNPALALMFLLSYHVWGHAYNDGLDKNTSHSWISISSCFTSLVLYGWFLGTAEINAITIMVALWAFLTIFYQIAWEGNLKDLWNPAEKNNLLRKLGVKLELEYRHIDYEKNTRVEYWRMYVPSWLDKFMYYLRVSGNTLIVLLTATMLGYNFVNNALFTAMFIIMLIASKLPVARMHNLVKKPFKRQELLELFGEAEAFEYYFFGTLLLLTDAWWLYFILLIYGVGYFVVMNRLLWGTKFGPKV